MRIAVTSTDGISVNEHFGKSDSFYVFDIKEGELIAIEKREVEPYCSNAGGVSDNPNHKLSIDKLSLIYNTVKDCNMLYTQQIGEKPMEEFIQLGMSIKLCSCPIESIIGCNGECK